MWTILAVWIGLVLGFIVGCLWASMVARSRAADADARLAEYLESHGVRLPL